MLQNILVSDDWVSDYATYFLNDYWTILQNMVLFVFELPAEPCTAHCSLAQSLG